MPDPQQRGRALSRSVLISADNAHGLHPNFSDRYDDNHGPLLNHGPVIKLNANQHYASNSETQRHLPQTGGRGRQPGTSLCGAQRHGLRQHNRPADRSRDWRADD